MKPCSPLSNDIAESRTEKKNGWIAASHALKHLKENIVKLEGVFRNWKIEVSQYALRAGFDEYLIQHNMVYLEQIHVFTSAKISADSALLPELGRICSPFSAVLFAETASYEIPTYKEDGTKWIYPDLVYRTASHCLDRETVFNNFTSAPKTLEVCLGNWEEGKCGACEGTGRRVASEDREQPQGQTQLMNSADNVSFHFSSSVWPNEDKERSAFAQTLMMDGIVIIQRRPLDPQRPEQYADCTVKFTNLEFGSKQEREGVQYEQLHVRVVIDSRQQDSRITVIKPHTNSVIERMAKQPSITEIQKYGVVWWGFSVEDRDEQDPVIEMPDPRLPEVNFEFIGETEIPCPPPEDIDIEIESYWSITHKNRNCNWRDKILAMSSGGGSYSNVAQLVGLKVPSDFEKSPVHRERPFSNNKWVASRLEMRNISTPS